MKDVKILIENGVNVEKSLELFGDMETYNESLVDFLRDVEEKMNQMRRYKEISDMSNYAILVHSLKSDAKYFGFERLAELAYAHEMESKKNNMYYVVEHYEELLREVNKVIGIAKEYMGEGSREESEGESRKEEPIDQTILVVDDSNIVVNFIEKIFHHSFQVIKAKDGKEAIEYIERAGEYKIVGMLLDLNMPNVDGFEVLEYIKEKELFEKIPVSIITGSNEKEIIERAFSYPIKDMLNKPFNELSIKQIVEKTIRS